MTIIYSVFIHFYGFLLKLASLFNPKAKLWVDGRKNLFERMEVDQIAKYEPLWFHAASLGEFEQGRPIIEGLKKKHPNKKILLTFFSPSGYEVRKDYEFADWIYYLPLDTKSNARKFLGLANPSMAIFIKYEFWPNFLSEIQRKKINTIVVSAIFRENQIFFKSYGAWMRKSLKKLNRLFVQDENSVNLLKNIGITEVEQSGDTRFDRVLDILKGDNSLSFVEEFKGTSKLFVAGSTWPEDDANILEWVNSNESMKTIIAPHNIDAGYMQSLKSKISKKVVLYSELDANTDDYDVLILNTIGILTKVYSYADMAYVGGGFGTAGLHNILEPLIFGIPVVIGPNFAKFREAVDLSREGGIIVVNNKEEFSEAMNNYSEEYYSELLAKSSAYIKTQLGATDSVIKYIEEVIESRLR